MEMNQKYFDAKFETVRIMIENLDKNIQKINNRTDSNEKDILALQLDNIKWNMNRKRLETNVKFVRWSIISLVLALVGSMMFLIVLG